MAKELDKVIEIGGEDYNVNAVKADYVKNSLKINKANLASDGSTKLAEFNGKSEVSINLVPTDGGKFRGPIRVHNAGAELTDNKNKHTSGEFAGEFFEDAVLNYHDIKDVVLANIKNNTIVYNWSGTTLTNDPTFDNAINSISIVQGPEAQASTFATFNNSRYNEYLAEIEKSGKSSIKYLPTYLYVGTTENKVYYGTADSTTAKLLAINSAGNVAEAVKLATPRKITVNLNKVPAGTPEVTFNGTSDIKPRVTGVLDPVNGGTGASNLNSVTVGYAHQLQDASDSTVIAGASDVIDNYNSINDIIFGVTTVAKATTADNAIKLGGQGINYYQKKITVNPASSYPNGPSTSDGADGDIWILY